jgi:hypothetical protein
MAKKCGKHLSVIQYPRARYQLYKIEDLSLLKNKNE